VLQILVATGLVGSKILSILEERNFPVSNLYLFASSRSSGRTNSFRNEDISVSRLTSENIPYVDFCFSALESHLSHEYAPLFVSNGAYFIDKSSAFRSDTSVLLCIPEVNGKDIPDSPSIVSSPNCSTIQLVLALFPLHKRFGIKRLDIATYQSVSGAGTDGIQTLLKQEKSSFTTSRDVEILPFPAPIHRNAIPQIGTFTDSGFCDEEIKLINETKRLLENQDIDIYPTTVRIPVHTGHSEAVTIEFENNFNMNDIYSTLIGSQGVTISENPVYALTAEGKDSVFVSRIRKPRQDKPILMLWIVADNLRKGAALNAVQIAETIINRKKIKE
jgi:aspartate-semialdehyde dehydrogenase